MRRILLALLIPAAGLLAGCDQLGIEAASAVAARKDAEGKAVGGACRHAGRAIEDCYAMNRKADKAAVFAGWRDMNDYMRENKIETVPPQTGTALANQQPAAEEKPAKASGKAAAEHKKES